MYTNYRVNIDEHACQKIYMRMLSNELYHYDAMCFIFKNAFCVFSIAPFIISAFCQSKNIIWVTICISCLCLYVSALIVISSEKCKEERQTALDYVCNTPMISMLKFLRNKRDWANLAYILNYNLDVKCSVEGKVLYVYYIESTKKVKKVFTNVEFNNNDKTNYILVSEKGIVVM